MRRQERAAQVQSPSVSDLSSYWRFSARAEDRANAIKQNISLRVPSNRRSRHARRAPSAPQEPTLSNQAADAATAGVLPPLCGELSARPTERACSKLPAAYRSAEEIPPHGIKVPVSQLEAGKAMTAATPIDGEYDYIVVGAGSAGC